MNRFTLRIPAKIISFGFTPNAMIVKDDTGHAGLDALPWFLNSTTLIFLVVTTNKPDEYKKNGFLPVVYGDDSTLSYTRTEERIWHTENITLWDGNDMLTGDPALWSADKFILDPIKVWPWRHEQYHMMDMKRISRIMSSYYEWITSPNAIEEPNFYIERDSAYYFGTRYIDGIRVADMPPETLKKISGWIYVVCSKARSSFWRSLGYTEVGATPVSTMRIFSSTGDTKALTPFNAL